MALPHPKERRRPLVLAPNGLPGVPGNSNNQNHTFYLAEHRMPVDTGLSWNGTIRIHRMGR